MFIHHMTKAINYFVVFKVISRNLLIVSGALIICAGIAALYSENLWPFIFSAIIALFFGVISFFLTGGFTSNVSLSRKDAYLTVSLSWLLVGLVGSLPYLFSGSIPSFINAFFESVSGFTTTGSSILTEIESLPKSILFWRSLTHWIGGIGIIVLVIIVMPNLRIGGYQLFTMESSLQEKIRPRVYEIGVRLLVIYLLLTAVLIFFLRLGKMDLFESVCHSFGTIATGGFSPKNSSIADYSPYIQYVIMVFMLLSGTNFVIHYYILHLDFKKAGGNEEFKFYFLVVFLIGFVISSVLFLKADKPFEEAFREGYFQVISIITCTGYSTADYLLWPQYLWMVIFFAMFFGGSTGSTAGGIKMVRHLIMWKNFSRVFRQLNSPHAIIPIRLNKNRISDEENSSILTFIALYLIIFAIGCFSLLVIGIDFSTASGSVATCMAGIGPGIGTVGPASNFAHLPAAGKYILTMLMLVGRLEIYTVLILFTRNFWRN